jgi:hypothetical protein
MMKTGEHNSSSTDSYDRDRASLFMVSILIQIVQADSKEHQPENSKLLRDFEMAYSWIIFLYETWHRRIPFVTETGHWGFTPEDIKAGDQACMFYGGQNLYILRKQTEHCNFMSEAYVLYCVNGEIFEMLDEGIVKEELFQYTLKKASITHLYLYLQHQSSN